MQAPQNKHTRFALTAIHAFFDACNIWAAIDEIENMLLAATSKRKYNKRDPYHLLYFTELLNTLLTAAATVDQQGTMTGIDITEEQMQTDFTKHYVDHYKSSDPFNNFPRSLSKDQCLQPTEVTHNFFRYRSLPQWQEIIKDLLEYALKSESLLNSEPQYNILKVRLHLLRLIEACHLINHRLYKNN